MKLKVSLLCLLGSALLMQPLAEAKSNAKTQPSIADERQAQQMKDINAGQRSGQLSLKQSEKLRKKLAHVARRKADMRAQDNGRLTVDNNADLKVGYDKVGSDIAKTKQRQASHL